MFMPLNTKEPKKKKKNYYVKNQMSYYSDLG